MVVLVKLIPFVAIKVSLTVTITLAVSVPFTISIKIAITVSITLSEVVTLEAPFIVSSSSYPAITSRKTSSDIVTASVRITTWCYTREQIVTPWASGSTSRTE